MRKTIHSKQQALLLELLIELRQVSGVSQTTLAERLRITQSEVSKHERGERGLDVLQLRQWVLTLGLPLEAFIEVFEYELLRQEETLRRASSLADTPRTRRAKPDRPPRVT